MGLLLACFGCCGCWFWIFEPGFIGLRGDAGAAAEFLVDVFANALAEFGAGWVRSCCFGLPFELAEGFDAGWILDGFDIAGFVAESDLLLDGFDHFENAIGDAVQLAEAGEVGAGGLFMEAR